MNYRETVRIFSEILQDAKENRDHLEREIKELEERMQFLDWLVSPSLLKNNRVKLRGRTIMGWAEQEVSILNVSFSDHCASGILVEVNVCYLDGEIKTKILDAGWFERLDNH